MKKIIFVFIMLLGIINTACGTKENVLSIPESMIQHRYKPDQQRR